MKLISTESNAFLSVITHACKQDAKETVTNRKLINNTFSPSALFWLLEILGAGANNLIN